MSAATKHESSHFNIYRFQTVRRLSYKQLTNRIAFLSMTRHQLVCILFRQFPGHQQDARSKAQKPQRQRRIRHTSQGDGVECNTAGGILMVDQGFAVNDTDAA